MTNSKTVPTAANDPVLKLALYWLSARVVHEHVHEYRETYPDLKGIEEDGHAIEFTTYVSFWLSALYVVAEGYIDLKLSDPNLDGLVHEHIDSLRLYRNATFHFQKGDNKHIQFHTGSFGRMNWAEDMHASFEKYFSNYTQRLIAIWD